jgi:hypothetical protein
MPEASAAAVAPAAVAATAAAVVLLQTSTLPAGLHTRVDYSRVSNTSIAVRTYLTQR